MKTLLISSLFTFISFLSPGQIRDGINAPCQIKLEWEMIERDIQENYNQNTHTYSPSYYLNKNYSVLLKVKGYLNNSYSFKWTITGIQNGFKYNSGLSSHSQLYMTNGDFAKKTVSIDEFKTRIGPAIPDLTNYEVLVKIFKGGKQICDKRLIMKPANHLIVSLGDSYASGEGLPDENGSHECDYEGNLQKTHRPAVWLDKEAHRSLKSAHAKVVKELQKDKHSTITFLSFASSGAGIIDGVMSPQAGKNFNKSQLDQLTDVIGNRRIDVLLMSIGGNDIGWSGIFEDLVNNEVHSPSNLIDRVKKTVLNRQGVNYQRIVSRRLVELRNRFIQLGNDINRRGIKFNLGLLVEYPELLMGNELGEVTKGCGKFRDYPSGDRINIEESEFIYKNAKRLNKIVSEGAETIKNITGQNFLHQGGIANAFLRHGYCSNNSYFVYFDESCRNQGDKDGVLHPNEKGTDAMAQILLRRIGNNLSNKPTLLDLTGARVKIIN